MNLKRKRIELIEGPLEERRMHFGETKKYAK